MKARKTTNKIPGKAATKAKITPAPARNSATPTKMNTRKTTPNRVS